MNDIVFAIDPGSIRTGWAFMRPPEQLVKAGLLLPDKQTASSEFRIGAMCRSLWTLLNYWRPGTILIEYGSGKINPRIHHGGGSGMQVHGISIGSYWRECVAWLRYQLPENQLNTTVLLITENDWTRGVPKKGRVAAIARMFQEYKPEQDPGGDIAGRHRAGRLVFTRAGGSISGVFEMKKSNNNPDSFRELLTQDELIDFLRIPEISKAADHNNVIENLKRMHDLPCIHISKQPLFWLPAVRRWIEEKLLKEQSR